MKTEPQKTVANWTSSLFDESGAEAYSSFRTVASDHRVVSMQVRLSLRQLKTTGFNEKVDWKAFSSRPDLQAKYIVVVLNRFHVLGSKREDEGEGEEENERGELRREEDATTLYQHFIVANLEAKKSLPKVNQVKRSHNSALITQKLLQYER